MNLNALGNTRGVARNWVKVIRGGDSIGKVSPDPVLRYASGDKRAEEARKNDRRKARED